MKNEKKLMIMGLVTIILSAGMITGSLINSSGSKLGFLSDFEVHEWGVFEQVYGSNIANVLGEPPVVEFEVKKPVIYFHYDKDLTDIVVEVEIDGDILVTIPDAKITDNGIGWIVDLNNNTIIAPDGTQYNYLFYECQMNITQGVIAFVTDDGENVTFYVKNAGDFEITDIFYIYGYSLGNTFWNRGLTYVHIDKLGIGEQKTITVERKNNSDYDTSEILSVLINNGLTEKESKDLLDYWENIWFRPTNMRTFAQMFYLMPQSVYDELLPISIYPTPEVIRRVGLFFITDIPVNTPILEEFAVEPCSNCGFGNGEYTNITWLDDDKLLVEVGVYINCCQDIGEGYVLMLGDELILGYEVVGENLCRCMCFAKMKYIISGIPKQDYKITLEPINLKVFTLDDQ